MSRRFLWLGRRDEQHQRALFTTSSRTDLAELLVRLDVEHVWSRPHKGYGVPLDRVADIEAAAETDAWVVRRRREVADR